MIHKVLIGGLFAAAAIPVIAQTTPVAQVAPVAKPAPVAPLRPMADHVMTRAEVQAMVVKHFERMDSNHDGAIAGDEIKPRGEWKRENVMIRRDGGNQVARGDVRNAREFMIRRDGGPREHHDPAAMFERLDSNKDGVINRDEFTKGHEVRVEKRVMLDGPARAGEPMRFRMHRKGAVGGMMGGRMIEMADTNKDGRITLQEATATALQHFDRVDTNRDGRLTPDEMRAGHREMRAKMHRAG